MKISNGKFGKYKTVELANAAGMTVKLCALGAGIMSIKVPDRDGVCREVTKLPADGYGTGYHGLVIGRTAGRIENAQFTIDGRTAKLEVNNHGADNLHGGSTGFHSKAFSVKTEKGDAYTDVVFGYDSPDGEGGYFGNVSVEVTYRVYERENKLAVYYRARPDCKTLLDLTNHAYFNMSGDLREPVTDQDVYINASRVGVLDERLIVRDIAEVTPQFDFRTPHKMGDHVKDECVQRYTYGYDHPFFLDARGTDSVACSLYSALSGIKLQVRTSYPCLVVFGDNFEGYMSTCFETQYHPDGVHQCPDDCGICTPDEPYDNVTEFEFSVAK